MEKYFYCEICGRLTENSKGYLGYDFSDGKIRNVCFRCVGKKKEMNVEIEQPH